MVASRAFLVLALASPVLVPEKPPGPPRQGAVDLLSPAWRMSEGSVTILVGGAIAFVATVLVLRRILLGRWGPPPAGPDPEPAKPPGLEVAAWVVGVAGLETALVVATLPPELLWSGNAMGNVPRAPFYLWVAGLSLPFLVAAHELGHAAVAAIVGLRTERLQIGPVAILRTPNGIRMEWRPIPIAGVLGFHAPIPADVGRVRARLAAVVLAGPVTSLVVGTALLAAAPGTAAAPSLAGGVTKYLPWVAGWVSLVGGGLGNLLPRRSASGVTTDGGLLLQLLRTSDPVIQMLTRFQAGWRAGSRPREWGIDAREAVALAPAQGDARLHLHFAAMSVALDTGQDALAAAILADLRGASGLPAWMGIEIQLQEIMLEAFRGRTEEASRKLLAGAWAGIDDGYLWMARAVVAGTAGSLREAEEAFASWERYLAAQDHPAQRRAGNEWAEDRLRALLANGPGSGAADPT